MSAQQLLDQILPILYSVKDDEKKLQQILDFLLNEIYEEPDETVEIPEKYRQTVHDIAGYIDCGLVCYLNPETLELEYIHPNEFDGYDRFEEEEEPDSTFDIDVNDLLPTPDDFEKWAKENGIDPIGKEDTSFDDAFGDDDDFDPALDFAGGFFNDDGTPINPDSVPVPGLCIICKKYQYDDPEENFLCMMNRNDQRNDPDFKCGVFEKM